MGLLDDLFGKEAIAQLQVLAKKKEAEVAQLVAADSILTICAD